MARLLGKVPVGVGGDATTSLDLAKPPEAANIDCNNSVLVSINLAKIICHLINGITAIKPLPLEARLFHCYCPTRPLPINCKYNEVPNEYCTVMMHKQLVTIILNSSM